MFTEDETTYIANVESDRGIAPKGTENGAKMQIVAARIAMITVFLMFK